MSKLVHLHEYHEKNGHLTDFAGFSLPLWFKGIISESLAVRNSVGLFDVSHMGRALVSGKGARRFLEKLTTNDVNSLTKGHGQYSLFCNEAGGIKDDLLVLRLEEDEYLLVYNAANREKDFDWMQTNSHDQVTIEDVSDSVAMFAVQGPNANSLVTKMSEQVVQSIPRFGCTWTQFAGVRTLISRTGYTGEDGFEIFVWNSTIAKPEKAQAVWSSLLTAGDAYGIAPCGLGARDILRLEAGLCLYGTDMDESTNPFEAKLSFIVRLNKDFIGKQRLQEIRRRDEIARLRVGLVTIRRVIPRHGFEIIDLGKKVGSITSGSISPAIGLGIAMGYVEREAAHEGRMLEVRIRDRPEKAMIVKPPFYDTSKYGYARMHSGGN